VGQVASIDIMTPSASEWNYACSATTTYGHGLESCASGCAPALMRQEPFPLFGALLNALHRGVKVRPPPLHPSPAPGPPHARSARAAVYLQLSAALTR
jgi:hypothetical protein